MPVKSSLLNECSALPEISIHSHDSFLDRTSVLESNLSTVRNFCISPTSNRAEDDSTPFAHHNGGGSADVLTFNCAQTRTSTAPSANASGEMRHLLVAPKTKGYACELCDRTFVRFTALLAHDDKTHAPAAEHSCPACGRLFVSAARLRTHEYLAHREKRHWCATCDKMFSSSKSLAVHRRLHTGQYTCDQCDFAATSKVYLAQHRRKHEDGAEQQQPSFVCSTCGKTFAHRSSLLRHRNLHAAHKGRSYRCAVCHLMARTASELAEHARTHASDRPPNAYSCTVCHKSFASKRVLATHAHRHRPPAFGCDVCDKKLFTRHDLRAHRETHSDCKTFSCFHCAKLFSYEKTLVRHLRQHCSRVRSDVAV